MRPATKADLSGIRACLGVRPELAMFPLSNLARFGFEGPDDYAPFFWVTENDGAVTDVLTISRNGMVMPFLPSGDTEAARKIITGRKIIGIIGPADHARPLAAGLGLNEADCTLSRDEPHYVLTLDDLIMPEGPGVLIPLQNLERDLFVEWRTTYHVEALGDTPEDAAIGADHDISRYAEADSHRALIIDGAPVAMTGFNAALPEIVQIGGVFTPPALRGRGYARRAVAHHLAEARAAGVTRATLFSASRAAARAYEAIGFEWIGSWSLILTKGPRDV